jgi:hypothetical protein
MGSKQKACNQVALKNLRCGSAERDLMRANINPRKEAAYLLTFLVVLVRSQTSHGNGAHLDAVGDRWSCRKRILSLHLLSPETLMLFISAVSCEE